MIPEFVRQKSGDLTRCPGEAHTPEGFMNDNCSICAPRWGLVEARQKERTLEQAREILASGMAIATVDVTDDAFMVLSKDRENVVIVSNWYPVGEHNFENYCRFEPMRLEGESAEDAAKRHEGRSYKEAAAERRNARRAKNRHATR